LRFVPLLNLLLYKSFFDYYGKVDPIKLSVNFSSTDVFSNSFINLVVWFLFSFVGIGINSEKIKKTALIFPFVNDIILSKAISISLIFFLFLVFYHFIMQVYYNYLYIAHLTFIFFLVAYLYGLLFWIFRNQYFLSFINLFLGLFFIFSPFVLGDSFSFAPKDVNFYTFISTLLIVFGGAFILSAIVNSKNNYFLRLVFENSL